MNDKKSTVKGQTGKATPAPADKKKPPAKDPINPPASHQKEIGKKVVSKGAKRRHS